jgi:hypothetical protein
MIRRALAGSAAALLLSTGLSASAQAPAAAPGGRAADGAVSRYVNIERRINALVWRPAMPGPKASVVLVTMHDESNNIDNAAGPNLARRGYTVITANTRTAPDPEDHDTDWDKVLADVGAGVFHHRAMPDVTKVVVWGHSSGGPLMAAYQNIAENGVAACQDAKKVLKCPDSLAGLPKADGVILTDPIFGVGANVLASVDPAITDTRPRVRDPALDVYNPKNGFDAKGGAYSAAFKKAYFAAEARKNNAMIAAAQVRYNEIKAGRGRFTDDEPFLAPGASRRPRLWPMDLHMLAHTKNAWPLLKADGTVSTQVIHSVRPPMATSVSSDRMGNDGSLNTSVKRFLNTFATRALPGYSVDEDSISGVDWASSYSNTPGNVEGITVPFLTMGMTGHYWIVSTEMAYLRVKSADKSIAFVEGATHGIVACKVCGGDYGDTVGHFYDYVAGWLGPRF